jgi:Lon-like ATP-dependent protease
MHGDPSSALLELLDPSQNGAFLDQYLDVTLDASQVLFVCTANVLQDIPGPLLDRLEVIPLSGYDNTEKVAIAKRHLEPKARKEAGMDDLASFQGFDDAALQALARWYTREAGVRSLRKLIDKAYRKVALDRVQSDLVPPHISEPDLVKYVGQKKYPNEKLFGDQGGGPGVVTGLAVNGEGGSVLYIEATALPLGKQKSDTELVVSSTPGGGSLMTTGRLGDTMKESTLIAYANARREVRTDFFDAHQVHVHVPDGATPKVGCATGAPPPARALGLALLTDVCAAGRSLGGLGADHGAARPGLEAGRARGPGHDGRAVADGQGAARGRHPRKGRGRQARGREHARAAAREREGLGRAARAPHPGHPD